MAAGVMGLTLVPCALLTLADDEFPVFLPRVIPELTLRLPVFSDLA
jgi:hypothetical protein